MFYYEVFPATKLYHGNSPLTYQSREILKIGQVVEVTLRKSTALAIVASKVSKPKFKTSDIDRKIEELVLPPSQLKLLNWLLAYYPSTVGAASRLFLPSYLAKFKKAGNNYIQQKFQKITPLLNSEQVSAYKKISGSSNGTFVIDGVTGSGKTRIYAEMARDTLISGKSSMILTPEIALTTPLGEQLKKFFKNRVEINHSNLTQKQRLELFQRVYNSKYPIILLGPRSTLFMPLKNLGLIIVDEFHESAYKQETSPYYHANRLASKLSDITGSKLIFGSATPPLIDYYLAEQKNAAIINLNTSAITKKPPIINKLMVDLTDNNEQTSYPLLSKTLIQEITAALNRSEQVMVFINKRGTYRSILCKNCGWQAKCKNCNLGLVYHQDKHLMICHTCGQKYAVPANCMNCGSLDIIYKTPGTKAVASSLAKIFPNAKIARYDKDNKKHERIESNFDKFSQGKIDIIVGTQMIVKGFDLPKLSVVAMLTTESSLNFPDFSSNERTYQLIKQLAGRVNRGHREGKIILQTYRPDIEVLKFIEKPWIEFYKHEIKTRKMLGFPPSYYALKIQLAKRSSSQAETELSKLADKFSVYFKKLKILGPSPCFIEKKLALYRWQLVIMSKNRRELTEIAKILPTSYKKDLDPINFL